MNVIFESHEIKNILGKAIQAHDDPLIKRALQTGGIKIGSDYSDAFYIDATKLDKGGKAGEVTQSLNALLRSLTGSPTEVYYPQSRFAGFGTNRNGNAEITISRDSEAISRAFTTSSNPVIRAHVEDRQKAMERFAAEEAERTARDEETRQREEAGRQEAQAQRDRQKGSPQTKDSLNPDALCITHATKYMPVRHPDGSVDITTTSMTTNNRIPRNTTHFCLNHKVESHMYGSWDNAPILIIAPFNRMCEVNGAPANLNTIDSFWTSGVNRALRVPNVTLVVPGNIEHGLYELDLKETRYKAEHFSSKDIRLIRDKLDEYDRKKFDEELTTAGADRDKMLAMYANRFAANATMEYLGYEVQPGGMWAWGGSWDVTHKTQKLASEMGTVCAPHTGTVHGALEENARRVVANIDFMLHLIAHPEPPLQYEHGSYHIPDTRMYVDDQTYMDIMSGKYFRDALERINQDTQRADKNTREVYADWQQKIAPDIERIARYTESQRQAGATAWRKRKHGESQEERIR